MKKIIKLRNLSVQYKKGISTITALNQVNLDIFEGEKLGVVGESGSGKSTLAKGVMRLEHSLGQIYFEDKLINNEPLNVAKMYKSYFKQLEKTKFLYAEFLKHLGKWYDEVEKTSNLKNKNGYYLTNLGSNLSKLFYALEEVKNVYKDKEFECVELEEYQELVREVLGKTYDLKQLLSVDFKPSESGTEEVKKSLEVLTSLFEHKFTFPTNNELFPKDKKPTWKYLKELKKDMQIVFQDPSTSLNERMSVEDIVSEGALNFKKELMDKNNPLPFAQQVKESVSKILSEVGLPETVLKRYQHELSGGQKQRISIARSMLIKPKFLIADEPISSLDVTIRAQILNLLNVFLKANNLTIMFIAHDLSVVRYFCDRIVVIYKGNVVEVASSLELFKNPVHPYTKKLLMSAPIKEVDVKEFSPEETEYNNDDEKYVFFPRTMVEVSPNHFVFANKEEVKKWKQSTK